ncbi:MAG: LLM class flavin-dependent oxidoreductase [Chloroflexi bacterium]|nr:LLM class flavin-dependent oxidoreductase [Chloroflexota bacterium]
MRFGAFWQVPGSEGQSIARRHWQTVDEIVLAEELGFETAWLAESPFYPARQMSNPLMVAVAAGQRTERIRFGTLAAQAPLHHPFDMATQAATCDILTNGRLDLCLGGRWGSPASQSIGHSADIPIEESRGRVAEAIELIRLAWTEERVNFVGDYWTAKDLPVLPHPVQQPHPPLLLATNSDSTFQYAAKLGVGMIATNMIQPTPMLAKRMDDFQAMKVPNQVGQYQPAHVAISFFVAETKEKARAIARENWRNEDILLEAPGQAASVVGATRPNFSSGAGSWATWDFEEAEKHCIYDDAAGCVERLNELQQALPHMDQCILEFNRRGRIPSELVMESMRLFSEKVKPELGQQARQSSKQ